MYLQFASSERDRDPYNLYLRMQLRLYTSDSYGKLHPPPPSVASITFIFKRSSGPIDILSTDTESQQRMKPWSYLHVFFFFVVQREISLSKYEHKILLSQRVVCEPCTCVDHVNITTIDRKKL